VLFRSKDEFPFWRLAAIGGAILVVLFLIFLFWINYTTGQAVDNISGTR